MQKSTRYLKYLRAARSLGAGARAIAGATLGARATAGARGTAAKAGAATTPRRSLSNSGKAATTATMAKRINCKLNEFSCNVIYVILHSIIYRHLQLRRCNESPSIILSIIKGVRNKNFRSVMKCL